VSQVDKEEAAIAYLIAQECDSLKKSLIEENRQAHLSSGIPARLFSTTSPLDRARQSLDDIYFEILKNPANKDVLAGELIKSLLRVRVMEMAIAPEESPGDLIDFVTPLEGPTDSQAVGLIKVAPNREPKGNLGNLG
jgi:hypothetical protein